MELHQFSTVLNQCLIDFNRCHINFAASIFIHFSKAFQINLHQLSRFNFVCFFLLTFCEQH